LYRSLVPPKKQGLSGLEVNGQLIREGKNLRLQRVFISTPRKAQIGIYPDKVTVGHDGWEEETFTFDRNQGYGFDDVHVEVVRYM